MWDYGIGKLYHAFTLQNKFARIIPYWTTYSISLPKTMTKGDSIYKGIALGIFMDYQYGIENFESLNSLIPHPKVCRGRCSGFANEDLLSDYLGFVAEVQGWDFTYVVDMLGGGKGLPEGEFPDELSGTAWDTVLCSLGGICEEDNPYNRCWTPKVLESEGKFVNVPWPRKLIPEELIIEPIQEFWWRGIMWLPHW